MILGEFSSRFLNAPISREEDNTIRQREIGNV